MTQQQTFTGFFDNKAEAQQAVQLLLDNGFTAEHIDFSTQAASIVSSNKDRPPTTEERSSGRFFSSIFGSNPDSRPTKPSRNDAEKETSRGNNTVVAVRVKSGLEVDQVIDLLKKAWKVNVSNQEK